MRSDFRSVLLFSLLLSATGCSSLGVEPWQRDVLAKDDMQLITDPVQAQEQQGWDFNTALLYYGESDGRVQDLSLECAGATPFY